MYLLSPYHCMGDIIPMFVSNHGKTLQEGAY